MLSLLRERNLRPMFAAAGTLFLLKSLFIIATPLRALVMSPWLIDDSFIVMRVARNVALGHGFSFDGTAPTTGVSMLWTYLTSLNHLVFSKEVAVKATLIESTLAGTLCAVVIFLMAMRLTRNGLIAWLTFILASLLPVLFFNAMNGMETALFSLCVILALAYASRTFTMGSPLKHGLVIGLYAGLALMMRADAIFLVAAIVAALGWRWLKTPQERRDTRGTLTGMIIAVAACFALFSLWQLWQTGSLFPDNQIGRRAIALAKHQFSYENFSLTRYAAIVLWNAFELDALVSLALGSSLLGLFAWLWHGNGHALSPIAKITGLYALLFCAALVLYQWYFPDFHGLRYLNPVAHIAALFLASLLAGIPVVRWRRSLITGFLAILLILSWYRYFDLGRQPLWAADMGLFGQRNEEAQRRFWSNIDYINENMPADAVIAVRDHGRIAYFTDRPVQDLAGILDPGILHAYARDELRSYLTQKNVSFVLLPDRVESGENIYQAVHRSLNPHVLDNAPVESTTGFRLYRLNQPST